MHGGQLQNPEQKTALSFSKFNRRTHLYAAMFFMPWFFVYGVSSLGFSHPTWFNREPQWNVLSERDYKFSPIVPNADLRTIANKIQQDSGLPGDFGLYRSPENLFHLYRPGFISATEIVYDPAKERLVVRETTFRVMGLLQRIHTRGGFEGSALNKAWGVIVDLVQIMMMIWIVSGLFMWWSLRHLRAWGWLALGAGMASFTFFILAL